MAPKTNTERQKTYREKQKSAGKKQISLRLPQETREILDRERARTGESIYQILKRLIEGLEQSPVQVPAKSPPAIDIHKKTVELIDVQGLAYGDVAGWFNKAGVPHPTGACSLWYWQTAKMVYQQAVKRKKPKKHSIS